MNKKEIEKFLGKTVKIDWIDAFGAIGVESSILSTTKPSNLLKPCISHGILDSVDTKGLILIHEWSIDQVDITVIPISLITDIKELIVKGG